MKFPIFQDNLLENCIKIQKNIQLLEQYPPSCPSVDLSVGFQKSGRLHFHAPIGALVYMGKVFEALGCRGGECEGKEGEQHQHLIDRYIEYIFIAEKNTKCLHLNNKLLPYL